MTADSYLLMGLLIVNLINLGIYSAGFNHLIIRGMQLSYAL